MTVDDYVYAAVLSHIGWQQIATGAAYKQGQLEERLLKAIGVQIPSALIVTALNRMADESLLEKISTGITEPYLKLNYRPINEYVTARVSDRDSAEYVYRRIGKQILIDALGGSGEESIVDDSGGAVDEPPPSLSEAKRVELVVELDRTTERLDKENVSNEVKSQAMAYIVAARTLAEAPEPPVGIIWDLVKRASQLAGVASLFIAILALFGR